MRSPSIALAILMSFSTAHADEKAESSEAAKHAPALAAALNEAVVTLAAALTASESRGTPISAKFELEDGVLQLSVYTMKGAKFFELVVDHKTGKVTKTKPITGGDDLAAANKQSQAMAKTKRSLRDVVTKVEQANAGYQAVSVTAEIEGNAARADVGLLKGSDWKQVEDKL